MYKFSLSKLTSEQKILRKRILEISFKSNLSHLGSCLSAIDLIDGIYKIKKKNEKFVLSNGHAGVALYVVLEKFGLIKNKNVINKLNIHPDRNVKYGINVSTGSLGQGLPIALGMALADRNKNVYCMLSDGECAEGSVWEALRVAYEKKIYNLKITINANGWSAYDTVDLNYLKKRLHAYGFNILKINGNNTVDITSSLKKMQTKENNILFANTFVEQFPFLRGLDAHYYVMNNEDYDLALRKLS